jgi:hypothetical protein
VAKAMRRKSGGCAVKECVLTRGYLALCLKGQRGNTERKGEALPDVTSDETGLPRRESEGAGRGLLEQVFARENMQRAWKRVRPTRERRVGIPKPDGSERELLRLGASPWVVESVAALSRRWWHNSRSAIHNVLTIAYFDRLGVPRLS